MLEQTGTFEVDCRFMGSQHPAVCLSPLDASPVLDTVSGEKRNGKDDPMLEEFRVL